MKLIPNRFITLLTDSTFERKPNNEELDTFKRVVITKASFSIIFTNSSTSLFCFFLKASISSIVWGKGGNDSIFSKIFSKIFFSILLFKK